MRSARSRLSALALWTFGASTLACGNPPVHPGPDAHTDFGPRTGATCPSTSVTYASFGHAFFSTYCVTCHDAALTGAARTGAPDGYDFDTLAGIRAHLVEIDEVAAAGPAATNTTMPFAGAQPTDAERQQLGQFLACGAPD